MRQVERVKFPENFSHFITSSWRIVSSRNEVLVNNLNFLSKFERLIESDRMEL